VGAAAKFVLWHSSAWPPISLLPSLQRLMPHQVLIVDDSKLARMVMVSAFRRLRPDWGLTEAVNADEALRVISDGGVDIALVDFNMPGTNGLDLVSRIRAVNPGMPVAVVSANVQDEIIARARELNAAFVAKPLTDEALGAFLSGAALRLRKSS
jgi:CheY-like chemotaxis protein